MKTGRIFAVVGPSGAGKDTLMMGAKAELPSLQVARRVITRPESAGGEDFEGVTRAEFIRRRAVGAFALWWEAHGLLYGIPISVRSTLAQGRDVMFNGSRAALPAARAAFPDLQVILVTAPPDVLAHRLAARGREAEHDILERLQRATYVVAPEFQVTTLENDGSMRDGIADLVARLQPESLAR